MTGFKEPEDHQGSTCSVGCFDKFIGICQPEPSRYRSKLMAVVARMRAWTDNLIQPKKVATLSNPLRGQERYNQIVSYLHLQPTFPSRAVEEHVLDEQKQSTVLTT